MKIKIRLYNIKVVRFNPRVIPGLALPKIYLGFWKLLCSPLNTPTPPLCHNWCSWRCFCTPRHTSLKRICSWCRGLAKSAGFKTYFETSGPVFAHSNFDLSVKAPCCDVLNSGPQIFDRSWIHQDTVSTADSTKIKQDFFFLRRV